MEFLPVLGALKRRAIEGKFAEVFDEAGGFAHGRKVRLRETLRV
jgi:hypothetical protein